MAKRDLLIDDQRRAPRWRRGLLAVAAVMLVAAGVAGGRWWSETSAGTAGPDAESAVPAVEGNAGGNDAATTTAQLVDVATSDVAETLSAEGTVAAAETEDLSFTSSGTVTDVRVAVGDEVSEGRILATIDSAELEAALAEAEADYAEAVAQLADDEDDAASDEQLAADQARVDVAADAVADAEESLDGARLVSGVSGTVTAVNVAAGEELGSGGAGGVSLTGSGSGSGNSASQLGSSSAMGASSGQSSTEADIQLVSTGRYLVELSIDSADIDTVAVGQEVTIEATTSSSTSSAGGFPGGGAFPGGDGGGFPGGFPGGDSGATAGGGQVAPGADQDAGDDAAADDGALGIETSGDSVTGTVTEVSAIADASSGVASYTVTVEFEDDSGAFLVGTSVVTDITISERTGVIQIPSAAVSNGDQGSTVVVALDGTVDGATETRLIETGETSGGTIEVTAGLSDGEQIVVELPSGMPIRPAAGDDALAPTDGGR